MTIVIPDPVEVPVWAWVVLTLLVWYPAFGRAMKADWAPGPDNPIDQFCLWLFSPVLVPAFCGFIAVCCVGGTAAWALSGGLTSPPWKWNW